MVKEVLIALFDRQISQVSQKIWGIYLREIAEDGAEDRKFRSEPASNNMLSSRRDGGHTLIPEARWGHIAKPLRGC